MSTLIPNPDVPVPDKAALLKLFKGKTPAEIQTPHIVIKENVFEKNCEKMADAVDTLGWTFRAHIKTHKTAEGAKLQAERTRTGKIIVSTLPELKAVVDAGLVKSGLVKDILYSMPLPVRLLGTLRKYKNYLAEHGATLRMLVDDSKQVELLEQSIESSDEVWSVFVKLDIGTKRAGLPPHSAEMEQLITAALKSKHVSIFGTYAHAGFSYASTSGQTAAQYLAMEVAGVNDAAKQVLEVAKSLDLTDKLSKQGITLAVGATPTAHAARQEWDTARAEAGIRASELLGPVELHAGNYCLLDEQQVATNLIDYSACALFVGATVISAYPQRTEALCDAGAIAMSKDVGPNPGFGPIVSPADLKGWNLGRTSQEHGILTFKDKDSKVGLKLPQVGEYIQIVPQHACLTAAQHAWLLVVDEEGKVVDVWLPCKGW